MLQAEFCCISKEFNGIKALKGINLDIQHHEIMAIVGPSGCGKSTLLHIAAGLLEPDRGIFKLAGQPLSAAGNILQPPEKRAIGMVFQKYALWPHYDVFAHIAYPLRMQGCSRAEQKQTVAKLLEMVRLDGMQRRYPHQLSGGEQQRVALARALALNPRLLLLDESLSNLDAALKKEMQEEIKRIQKELSLTIIHVTHDQQEAMSIADRIAVMNKGKLIQVGAVEEVYRYPRTEFAARFMGDANLIRLEKNNPTEIKLWDLARQRIAPHKAANINGNTAILAVRSEDIRLDLCRGQCSGEIINRSYQGSVVEYHLRFYDRLLKVRTSPEEVYEPGQQMGFTIERATSVLAD